ncbi:uncharacterized protein LOC6566997 isoform X2 [Drosophila grimshawi]|uniref:uncharacterized protein LOC6566997 isoform X2 n=1 Tax=Drosophila grimshawi TaxID=7222 RepID=UPI000C86E8B9|nr:uncharacterized protein LOC6566997 isoform X2 [Drosophila grimshawi]
MAMPIGIAWNLFLLVLLMLTSYVCIYLEFWKSRCTQPFVEIGDNCYFLSTNKAPTYDYYKVSYKGHIFSVPAELDWLQARFACETLDANAQLLTMKSVEEMSYLANYMRRYAHSGTQPFFWSGGHRGSLSHSETDLSTLDNYYWHFEPYPMNYSNFFKSNNLRFASGFCVYLEYIGGELLMATASCNQKMPFACQLQPLH